MEILDYSQTQLGMLCLRRRQLLSKPGTTITEVLLDHEFLMSSYNTASEKALSERALQLHSGSDLRVLVGGLGLGFTAWEALKSERVARVEVVEFLPQVISWLSRGLVPLSEELCADERLVVVEGDVYKHLAAPATETYDLILIDVDHNPDEALHPDNLSFYSVPGIKAAKQHLASGGVIAVWSSAEDRAFAKALEEVFGRVIVEPVVWWNDLIDEEQRDQLFLAVREDS